ncbi:MAG: ribonuclease III [Bacteroidota bacterium]|jgi:ribonuclease-3
MLLKSLFKLLFSSDHQEKNLIRSLRNLLGFYPGNISVYQLAFSHRSISRETDNGVPLSNERLEYLGDAVLGAVVADMLFKKFPYRDEGFLTEMRSRIVSRENLKNLAVKIGIDELLQKEATPGTYRSMYGDAFEALIGAIYLDKGYAKTQNFILERIIRIHVDLHEIEQTEKNFKSLILNWGQREKHTIVFETVEEEQKDRLIKVRLLVDDNEVAVGVDFVKKKAEQIAAQAACTTLGLL